MYARPLLRLRTFRAGRAFRWRRRGLSILRRPNVLTEHEILLSEVIEILSVVLTKPADGKLKHFFEAQSCSTFVERGQGLVVQNVGEEVRNLARRSRNDGDGGDF